MYRMNESSALAHHANMSCGSSLQSEFALGSQRGHATRSDGHDLPLEQSHTRPPNDLSVPPASALCFNLDSRANEQAQASSGKGATKCSSDETQRLLEPRIARRDMKRRSLFFQLEGFSFIRHCIFPSRTARTASVCKMSSALDSRRQVSSRETLYLSEARKVPYKTL